LQNKTDAPAAVDAAILERLINLGVENKSWSAFWTALQDERKKLTFRSIPTRLRHIDFNMKLEKELAKVAWLSGEDGVVEFTSPATDVPPLVRRLLDPTRNDPAPITLNYTSRHATGEVAVVGSRSISRPTCGDGCIHDEEVQATASRFKEAAKADDWKAMWTAVSDFLDGFELSESAREFVIKLASDVTGVKPATDLDNIDVFAEKKLEPWLLKCASDAGPGRLSVKFKGMALGKIVFDPAPTAGTKRPRPSASGGAGSGSGDNEPPKKKAKRTPAPGDYDYHEYAQQKSSEDFAGAFVQLLLGSAGAGAGAGSVSSSSWDEHTNKALRNMDDLFDLYEQTQDRMVWSAVWSQLIAFFVRYMGRRGKKEVFEGEVQRFRALASELPKTSMSFSAYKRLRDMYMRSYKEDRDDKAVAMLKEANNEMQKAVAAI
jgi:hypothetical protein